MSDIAAEIVSLADAETIDAEALEEACNSATHAQRVEAIRQFSKSLQRRLFEQMEGRSVTIDQIVPPGVDPLTEVIHEGQNTLPVFRAFQKRFCRPDPAHAPEDRELLWGYNEQTMKPFTGPGYFVAYDDEETGEVAVDYREIPDNAPDQWPDIIPNERRLGRFVYAGTVDRLRRVSEHITIGRAFKDDDEPMPAWFVLVRKD